MINMIKGFIPEKLYKKIVKTIPITCVDLVIKREKYFLLVKRKKNPAKDKWWFPGGRLLLNESLRAGAKRKLKEELGIKKIKTIKFLAVEETKFKKGYFEFPSHSVNVTFLAEIDNFQAKNINLDTKNHLDYKWFQRIPAKTDPYVKNFLKLAGFK